MQAVGDDNDARFSGTAPVGSYTVNATLASSVGVGLTGTAEVDLMADAELTVRMEEAEVMG